MGDLKTKKEKEKKKMAEAQWLHSAWMVKRGEVNTGWKKRWFALGQNSLSYYKDMKSLKVFFFFSFFLFLLFSFVFFCFLSFFLSPNLLFFFFFKGKPLGVVPLDNCFLERDPSRDFALRLVHPERRIYYFAAESEVLLPSSFCFSFSSSFSLPPLSLFIIIIEFSFSLQESLQEWVTMFEFVNVKMSGRKEEVMTTRHLRAGYLHKRGAIQTNWKKR